ncbi:hypothetical protein BU601_12930 [Staphylococcus arlettae]|uniref:hypothetical protein n=1 Tax=Staphylococcus arlettae TaxID=29378 RepID=UPI000D199C4A|nr:hypothetical protein [Staphylococcus arlettae]PTH49815.1 hypothetical protein BU601_12930 [Staphylococcus arlettae]
MKKRKSLSEIIPIWYRVAERKETIRRHVKDLVSNNNFSNSYLSNRLPNEIYRHKYKIIKTGKDIDPLLPETKAFNIELSSSTINGLVIQPNDVFS